jgi:GTP-binding protein HflX
VNAFRATLEEARYADLLLHVVDISSPNRQKQMEVVTEVLTQLEAHNNPTLTVYNKSDAIENAEDFRGGTETVLISAKKNSGIDTLKAAITNYLSNLRTQISILLPQNSGAIISRLYKTGQVHTCDYREDGIFIHATVTADEAARLRALV